MPPAEATRSFRRAVALGLLQGPTELLPISSSAHTRLIDPGRAEGRSFDLALHGAACIALALEMAGPLRRDVGEPAPRRVLAGVLAIGTPAIAGLTLRSSLERRLSGRRATAAGLIAGGVAMALADRMAPSPGRAADDAGPLDGLALGFAQTLALAPGVSRNGATLTAARARGFARPACQRLSWAAGLPVMGGASAAEALKISREGTLREPSALLGGALGAFFSTLLSARVMARRLERAPLWPFAVYRCLLAIVILVRTRRAQ